MRGKKPQNNPTAFDLAQLSHPARSAGTRIESPVASDEGALTTRNGLLRMSAI
jgi:hypothetical protein